MYICVKCMQSLYAEHIFWRCKTWLLSSGKAKVIWTQHDQVPSSKQYLWDLHLCCFLHWHFAKEWPIPRRYVEVFRAEVFRLKYFNFRAGWNGTKLATSSVIAQSKLNLQSNYNLWIQREGVRVRTVLILPVCPSEASQDENQVGGRKKKIIRTKIFDVREDSYKI